MLLMRYGGKDLDFTKGAAHILSNGYLWILGLALGWVAGLSFALIVTRLEMSTAVSLYVPLTYFFSVLLGVLVLKEQITPNRIAGALCLVVGLYFIMVEA